LLVIPAQAEIHFRLDSRLRGNDKKRGNDRQNLEQFPPLLS